MSIAHEHIDATPGVVYLAKHPFYSFALIRSTASSPSPNPEPPLVELQFNTEPHQQRVQLTLAALEEFHDAVSRLLDYVKQERARWTAFAASSPPMEDALAPSPERLDHGMDKAQPAAHRPGVRFNRLASPEWLCSVSGIVLAGLVALLSWTLYSLSAGQGESKSPPPAVQESASRPSAAAVSQEASPREPIVVQQPPVNGPASPDRTGDDATEAPGQSEGLRSSAAVRSSSATPRAEAAPHISLHIQSPAQHTVAQRLATQLQQKGYLIPKEATLVAKGPSRTEVRYFHTDEAEEAAAIAMLLHQAYRPPATVSYRRGRRHAVQSQARHYEIWLGPEPR